MNKRRCGSVQFSRRSFVQSGAESPPPWPLLNNPRSVGVRLLVILLLATLSAAAETTLPIVGTLGTGPAMDVAVVGDRAFVIGRGKLHVVDIRFPAKPKVRGSIDGLGNTRQIAVAHGVAYVSARESGLFIVDVREATPKLITHYDSIEWATGVAIAGRVLFIAERNFGVELVDVNDPHHPKHLTTIRTGERNRCRTTTACSTRGFGARRKW